MITIVIAIISCYREVFYGLDLTQQQEAALALAAIMEICVEIALGMGISFAVMSYRERNKK